MPGPSSQPRHAASNGGLPRVQPVHRMNGVSTALYPKGPTYGYTIVQVKVPWIATTSRGSFRIDPSRWITSYGGSMPGSRIACIPCSGEAERSQGPRPATTPQPGCWFPSVACRTATPLASRQARARPKHLVMEKPHRNGRCGGDRSMKLPLHGLTCIH